MRKEADAVVAQGQVLGLMQPWLGTELTAALAPAAEDITRRLNAYTIRQDPDELLAQIDSLLFRAVHGATRGSMIVALPDGSRVRMRLDDISALADEILFLALNELPADQKHLQAVQQFSLRRDSLSALRALYVHFAPLETREELNAIAALTRNCYPPFRWREWLDG